MNVTPPTKEASADAFRYLKKRYNDIPEKTKCIIISQFQTTLKGIKRYKMCGG